MTVSETQPDGSLPDRDEAYCSACGQSFPLETDLCPNDGARLIKLSKKADSVIGRVFEKRYEVRTKLGAGGMGTVYRGWQLSVDREVAIKVIDPRLSSDRTAVKRFLREARLASRLSQPNIVNVYDFGQTEDGILYLVMELLKGRTLGHEARGEPWGLKRAANVVLQLCDALESAHAQGIIHRDLKPGNIIVLDDPPGRDLIKVLDFGLAKSLAGDALSRVTKTDTVLGTPLYMPPEQIDGKPSDQRGDLYAVGCMFYELLVGRPPFQDANMHALMARHMNEPPPALPDHVPANVAALIHKMLAKLPELRTQSAGEVRSTLQACLEPGSQPTIVDRPGRPPISVPPSFQTAPTIDQPRRGGRVVLAIVALAVLVTGGVLFVTHGSSQHEVAIDAGAIAPPPPIKPDAAPAAVTAVDAAVSTDAAVTVDAGKPHPHPRPDPNAIHPRPDAGVVHPKPTDAAVAPPPPPVDASPPPLDFPKPPGS